MSDLKLSDIVLYDPYEENNDITKIDISLNKNQQAIMIQFEELPIIDISEKNIVLSLKDKELIQNFFNELDKYIVNIIQERKITKKLQKKFNYRQLISTDILNLCINFDKNNDYITEVYESKNNKLSQNDIISMLKINGRAQVILELKSINFNKKDGVIYFDNIVRQMKVRKLKPKRIANIKYSFTDSPNNVDTESINKCDDDCLINNNDKSDQFNELDNFNEFNKLNKLNDSEEYNQHIEYNYSVESNAEVNSDNSDNSDNSNNSD